MATESEVDSYIFNISNDSSGSTLLGSSTGEGTAGQGLMASFPRAVSRKNTPSHANNQQYVDLTTRYYGPHNSFGKFELYFLKEIFLFTNFIQKGNKALQGLEVKRNTV